MTVQWISASMTTGLVGDDLATFVPDYPIRHTLSNYDTATGKLYLDGAAPDWEIAVQAGGSVVARYDDADPDKSIQWAGYVTLADPDSSLDAVSLSLTTIEGYLMRRFTGDLTYTVAAGWTRNTIIADLVSRYINTAGGLPGIPLQMKLKGGASDPKITADLVWQNTDNATVLSRVQSLLDQYGGEFSISWAWSTDGRSIVPTMTVGTYIGVRSGTGVPAVTLEQPGPILSVSMPDDYSDGAGANHVTAYSSGSGSVTPYSTPAIVADFQGRPTFEYRWQPVANQPDTTVLGTYATQALAILSPGARPLSIVLALDALDEGRRLGADWNVGDDVGYSVDPTPAFPRGLAGTARAIAVDLDETTLTPIFAQPEVYTEAST